MSQAEIESASPSLNTVNKKKFPRPASIEQMYRNLILDTLGHIYRGRRSRYSNFDTLGSSIELQCDAKSDFSYDAYGTLLSIELNCDVKFGNRGSIDGWIMDGYLARGILGSKSLAHNENARTVCVRYGTVCVGGMIPRRDVRYI